MPSTPAGTKIAFVAGSEEAAATADHLANRYASVEPDEADIIVALGGDGHMLQMLHRFMSSGKPIYGMNQGSVGFLMNEYQEDGLMERLAAAETSAVRPLVMEVVDADGKRDSAYAINEVSMIRQSYQAAKLQIAIDGKVRLEELICDGILVATPAGSTAYNLSAHGPILPINAPLLAITPISAFRPRRWRGALVPDRVEITIDVLEAGKRPVNAVADHTEVKSVSRVTVKQDRQVKSLIMFDPDHGWDERILTEQFLY